MTIVGYLLVWKVLSGGALGGMIGMDVSYFPTQIACESALKSVQVKQTTQQVGDRVTHTFVAYCKAATEKDLKSYGVNQ